MQEEVAEEQSRKLLKYNKEVLDGELVRG